MLTLAPNGTIQGVANTAAVISVSMFGVETASVTDTYKVLYQGQLASSAGVLYTATAVTTLIKTITLTNTTASPVTGVILYVNGVAASNQITQPMTLPANGCAVFNGEGWHVYDANGRVLTTTTPAAGYMTMLNVLDYGAKGDSVTDDTNAIKAAIAAAAAAGVSGRGVSLWFPAGIYLISSTLAITQNNIRLMGAGQGSTVIYPNSSTFLTGDVIQFGNGTGHAGIELNGIEIYCAAARTSGYGINVNFVSDVQIRDFAMNNMFTGIMVQGGSIKVTIAFGTINNCYVGTGIGIRVLNGLAGDTYIGPNIVFSNSLAPLAGISLEQTGHTSIYRTNITKHTYGIQIIPSAVDVSYVFCDHSLFDSSVTAGMLVAPTNSASSRVRSLYFTNSWFAGSTGAPGYGIWFNPGGTAAIIDDLNFIGCRIMNNQYHGVLWALNSATFLNFRFLNCTLSANGQAGTNTYDGFNIVAGLSNFMISGCRIGPAGTAQGGATAQRYAINILAGASTNFIITGNDVSGNGTAPFIFNGATALAPGALPSGSIIFGNYPGPNWPLALNLLAASTAATTTETVLLKAQIPANAVAVGSQFRVTVRGYSSSTGTLLFRVRCGAAGTTSDTAVYASPASAAQVANQWAQFSADVTIRTIGATGTIQASGIAFCGTVVLPQAAATAVTYNIATTALWYIDATCLVGTTGTFTAVNATIEQV